jgi:DNA-directed RNA polymerase subunit alpha
MLSKEESARIASALRKIADAIGKSCDAETISDLKLTMRSMHTMNRLGITTIDQLCEKTADELLAVYGFGVSSLQEVRESLERHGRKLKDDDIPYRRTP